MWPEAETLLNREVGGFLFRRKTAAAARDETSEDELAGAEAGEAEGQSVFV